MAGEEVLDGRAAEPRSGAPRSGKPPELEDWLNARLYHPLSARLAAVLERTPVTPNMVSFAGGACVVAAGIFYVGLAWPLSVLLGLGVHALWHVLDGADGDLARRTGRASPWGELIDGACDYVSHFLLYVIIGVTLAGSIGWWAYPLGLAAGISRIIQSNHSESCRRTYLWRVYGIPWLKQARAEPLAAEREKGVAARLMAAAGQAYVAAAADPLAARVDALMEGGRAGEAARRLCMEASRRPLRIQTVILGPNLRTLALGLSMATGGSALWFFLYEVLPLNALLIWSKRLQRRCDRELAERLEV